MRLDKIRANKESGENMYLLSGNPNHEMVHDIGKGIEIVK
jgi:hypothetical protein